MEENGTVLYTFEWFSAFVRARQTKISGFQVRSLIFAGSKFVFLNLFLAVSLFSSFLFKKFSDQPFFQLLFLGFVHLTDFLDLKGLEST